MTIRSVDKYGDIDKNSLIEKLQTLPDGKEIYDTDKAIYVAYPDYIFEIDLETGDVKYPEVERVDDTTPGELAGEGTETNPYLIESIEDLVAFSNNVNNGTNYSWKYIKLVRTLDFKLPLSYVNSKTKVSEKTNRIIEEDEEGTEILTFLTTGTGFNPIGSQSKGFGGIFEGNYKEIRNIYINRPEENYVGLFGFGANAQAIIKNIGISGNIIGNQYVGGIIGSSTNMAKVQESYNKCNLFGKGATGGISGGTANITNCYNAGIVKNEPTAAQSSYSAGGIIGDAQSGKINNCYNIGTVETQKAYWVGGISGAYGNIYNCVNIGNINCLGTSKTSHVGGITGGKNSNYIIDGCYNIGMLDYNNAVRNGGILGTNDTDNVTNSYYLKGTATGGIYGTDIAGKAEVKEASEMPKVIDVIQNKITVDGQEIDAWKEDTNNINNGYPILYWQE